MQKLQIMNKINKKILTEMVSIFLFYCFSERKGEGKVRLLTTTHYVREINA